MHFRKVHTCPLMAGNSSTRCDFKNVRTFSRSRSGGTIINVHRSYQIIACRLTHECHMRSPGVRDTWPSFFDILIPAFESVQTSSRHLTIGSKPARECVQHFSRRIEYYLINQSGHKNLRS